MQKISVDVQAFSGKFSVYLCYIDEECVYVGFSKIALYRVFEPHHTTKKEGLTRVDFEIFDSEKEARDREQELAFRLKPRFNVFLTGHKIAGWKHIPGLLKPRTERVRVLYYEQGKSERQIADEMGLTQAAVHSLIRTARRQSQGFKASNGKPRQNHAI